MEKSRREILGALGNCRLDVPPLPSLDRPWVTYEDPCRQLVDVTAAVGGQALVVRGADGLSAAVSQLETYRQARRVCWLVPGVDERHIDPRAVETPHGLEPIDFAIVPGVFAVAENGAVWVTDEPVHHRALYFIVEHLALVVPVDEIVHNMHEAYRRLALAHTGFGTFISGPSKTADIEQSLVIGAQGPRSLTLFLVTP